MGDDDFVFVHLDDTVCRICVCVIRNEYSGVHQDKLYFECELSIYIILIKFESLSVCLSVCVLRNSSYTFKVRITDDTSKDFFDPRECFRRIYF